MLLGDLIGRLDDDTVVAETLMALDDLALVQRARNAAAAADLDLGAFVAATVRRYVNQAPADEWTTLMGSIDRSSDPGSALIRRSLAFILDHDGHGQSHAMTGTRAGERARAGGPGTDERVP